MTEYSPVEVLKRSGHKYPEQIVQQLADAGYIILHRRAFVKEVAKRFKKTMARIEQQENGDTQTS